MRVVLIHKKPREVLWKREEKKEVPAYARDSKTISTRKIADLCRLSRDDMELPAHVRARLDMAAARLEVLAKSYGLWGLD